MYFTPLLKFVTVIAICYARAMCRPMETIRNGVQWIPLAFDTNHVVMNSATILLQSQQHSLVSVHHTNTLERRDASITQQMTIHLQNLIDGAISEIDSIKKGPLPEDKQKEAIQEKVDEVTARGVRSIVSIKNDPESGPEYPNYDAVNHFSMLRDAFGVQESNLLQSDFEMSQVPPNPNSDDKSPMSFMNKAYSRASDLNRDLLSISQEYAGAEDDDTKLKLVRTAQAKINSAITKQLYESLRVNNMGFQGKVRIIRSFIGKVIKVPPELLEDVESI